VAERSTPLPIVSLQRRNGKARFRMHPCAQRVVSRAKVIRKFSVIGEKSSHRFQQWRWSLFKNRKKESNMFIKLLGAAAMAAVAYAAVPANAASGGCSGPNLAKTESMVEAMPDGEGKIVAQKEMALAQEAMLDGKMGACGMHLSKAMHVGMAK
jgi:hypothetical protein